MKKEAGLVPIFLIVPALIFLTVGVGVGAHYYSQNQSQPSSVSSTVPSTAPIRATNSTPSPLPFDTPEPILNTPLLLNTPSSTNSATILKVHQEASESGELGPKCGIIFETGFNIFVEEDDDPSTITQKAIDQYLAAKPRLTPARDNLLSYLTTAQRKIAGDYLAKTITQGSIKSGQKISFSCTEVEKACLEAKKDN